MLEPVERLKEMELAFDFTSRMAYTEELKDFPYADVWNYFCYKIKFQLVWIGWKKSRNIKRRVGIKKIGVWLY